jgi:PAS domain S-box-containing protein
MTLSAPDRCMPPVQPFISAIVTFLSFCVIAASIGFWQHHQNVLIAENAFLYQSDQLADRIEARLMDYQQALRGVRGAFTAKPDAVRADFDAYAATRNMAKEFPGAIAMGFVRRTRGESGDAMRLELLHPPELEQKTVGFDLASEPRRRATALRAMRSGEATLSPPLEFAALERDGSAFVYLLPVYRRDLPADTPERREVALLGWSLVVIDIEQMLRPFFDGRLDFATFDILGDTGPVQLFFDADGHLSPGTPLADAEADYARRSLLGRRELDAGARKLHLLISPLPEFWRSLGLVSPWLFVLGGLVIAVLSALSVYLLTSTRRQAELLAKEMTEELRQSEERAREFSLSVSDWFWETDAEHRFTYFSENFEKILHLNAARMLGKRRDEVLAEVAMLDADLLARHLACIAAHVPFRDFEYRVRGDDGGECWVAVSGVPHFDAAGCFTGYRGTGTDVTARKTAEEAMICARDEAERANRAKSEFLSSMSHELRTPLNAILGFAQLLRHDASLNTDQRDSMDEILKAGRHLLDLINEVLDLACIESGQLSLSLEPVELDELVRECRQLVHPLALARELTLRANEVSRTVVRADRVRLKQAIINLLSNAIKYNRTGGRVELSVWMVDVAYVRIEVVDTGLGIPAGILTAVFEPFNRAGRDGSNIEGTGIGLTITRRLVELMGGKIAASSEVGVGSRFWIDLPIVRNEKENPR